MAEPSSFTSRLLQQAMQPATRVPFAAVMQPTQAAPTSAQSTAAQRQRTAYLAALANPDMPIEPQFSTGSATADEQAMLRARYARMLAAGQAAVAERAAAQGRTLQTAPDGTQFYGAPDPTRAIGNYRVRPSGLMEDQVQTLPTGELALYDRTGRLVGTTARVESLSDRYDPKDVDSFGNPKRLPMDAIDRRAFNEGRGTASEREAFGSALIDTVRNQMSAQPRNAEEAARWEARGRAMQAMRQGTEVFNRQFADQGARMTPTGGFVMTPMAGATAPAVAAAQAAPVAAAPAPAPAAAIAPMSPPVGQTTPAQLRAGLAPVTGAVSPDGATYSATGLPVLRPGAQPVANEPVEPDLTPEEQLAQAEQFMVEEPARAEQRKAQEAVAAKENEIKSVQRLISEAQLRGRVSEVERLTRMLRTMLRNRTTVEKEIQKVREAEREPTWIGP
jgi:hypothetical protein